MVSSIICCVTRKIDELPCGIAHNAYWNDIQSEVTLDDLFADA